MSCKVLCDSAWNCTVFGSPVYSCRFLFGHKLSPVWFCMVGIAISVLLVVLYGPVCTFVVLVGPTCSCINLVSCIYSQQGLLCSFIDLYFSDWAKLQVLSLRFGPKKASKITTTHQPTHHHSHLTFERILGLVGGLYLICRPFKG